MADDAFHRVNPVVVRGPARLLLSSSLSLATAVTDVIHSVNYNAKPKWDDLGSTKDGISIAVQGQSSGFGINQTTGIPYETTDKEVSVTTKLAEVNLELLDMVWNTGVGEPQGWQLAVLFKDPEQVIRAHLFRRVFLEPQGEGLTYAKTGPQQTLAVRFKAVAVPASMEKNPKKNIFINVQHMPGDPEPPPEETTDFPPVLPAPDGALADILFTPPRLRWNPANVTGLDLIETAVDVIPATPSGIHYSVPPATKNNWLSTINSGGFDERGDPQYWWPADKDVVVNLPTSTICNRRVYGLGGRNILVKGGHILNSGNIQSMFTWQESSENIFFEGVVLDLNNFYGHGFTAFGTGYAYPRDTRPYTKFPNIYLQNTRIINVRGVKDTTLASGALNSAGVKIEGSIGGLFIDRVTIHTDNIGFMLAPKAPISLVEIRNSNVEGKNYSNPLQPLHSIGYYFVSNYQDATDEFDADDIDSIRRMQTPYPVKLYQSYMTPKVGSNMGLSMGPGVNPNDQPGYWTDQWGRDLQAVPFGAVIVWPNAPMRVSGFIGSGPPSGGDAAPATGTNKPGINYDDPGYQD